MKIHLTRHVNVNTYYKKLTTLIGILNFMIIQSIISVQRKCRERSKNPRALPIFNLRMLQKLRKN
ncbi:hypothetical protein BpHYR1_032218 [Brachionus plicatilis]|uniref:Uncharacterized protein n=1 Tax=Brachionus plicatilis TaxID=10195 RepID=A0A3M7R475_BRAPC|nr:hypothetical protein BpHYR1_032218 [Brachionus plicatilis]